MGTGNLKKNKRGHTQTEKSELGEGVWLVIRKGENSEEGIAKFPTHYSQEVSLCDLVSYKRPACLFHSVWLETMEKIVFLLGTLCSSFDERYAKERTFRSNANSVLCSTASRMWLKRLFWNLHFKDFQHVYLNWSLSGIRYVYGLHIKISDDHS